MTQRGVIPLTFPYVAVDIVYRLALLGLAFLMRLIPLREREISNVSAYLYTYYNRSTIENGLLATIGIGAYIISGILAFFLTVRVMRNPRSIFPVQRNFPKLQTTSPNEQDEITTVCQKLQNLKKSGMMKAHRRNMMKYHLAVQYRLLMALILSLLLTFAVTEFIKHVCAALRPDFVMRCYGSITNFTSYFPNALQNNLPIVPKCVYRTAKVAQDARKSFPSGHAATIFSVYAFCALFWFDATRLLTAERPDSGVVSTVLSTLILLPAIFVAASRNLDNRHHPVDLFAGALIGTAIAWLCYAVYFPAPFSLSFFTPPAACFTRHKHTTNDTFNTQSDNNQQGFLQEHGSPIATP